MIKNNYKIENDIVYMDVRYKDEKYICEFNISDLSLIETFNAKWCVKKQNEKIIYVYCSKKIEGKSKTYTLHRIIFDNPKDYFIDHKDRNPLNNKRDNLRTCTNKENSRNRTKNRESKGKSPTSKYKGVFERYGNYYVKLKKENKGVFHDEIVAANYYNHLALKEFGEFANLNNVEYISLDDCENLKVKSTSKYKGVHWNNKENKWVAQVYDKDEKKQLNLGRYNSEELAYQSIREYYQSRGEVKC